jgi:nucleotide-binding universal stress UspA family protein
MKREVPPLRRDGRLVRDPAKAGVTSEADPDDIARDVIVVGVDGSEQSRQALRWGRFMADQLGCTLQVVTAWQLFPPSGWAGYSWAVLPSSFDPVDVARQILVGTVDSTMGGERPGGLVLTAVEGAPVKVLLDAARAARMLVVGSRGHGGFAGLLLGSVSSACAEHAACPVLVIHGDTRPPPG